MSKWTQFMDMHSGGSSKLKWEHIFIEAPQAEAEVIFYNRFGHNPHRVTCTCCGEDYSISESENLEQATAYERGCDFVYVAAEGNEISTEEWCKLPWDNRDAYAGKWVEQAAPHRQHRTLEEYKASGEALFIYADEIQPDERKGTLPEQGYVWVD